MHSRRERKSITAELVKETALAAGKRVLVVTPDSTTLQRRKKHLTLIEDVQKEKPEPLIIYDDYYP